MLAFATSPLRRTLSRSDALRGETMAAGRKAVLQHCAAFSPWLRGSGLWKGSHQITFRAVVLAAPPVRSLTSHWTARGGFEVFASRSERTALRGRTSCLRGPGSCFCQCLWLDASEEGGKLPKS